MALAIKWETLKSMFLKQSNGMKNSTDITGSLMKEIKPFIYILDHRFKFYLNKIMCNRTKKAN